MIAKDKKLHFACSFLATLISPLFALGLGLGKEYGDSKDNDNFWDWWDIVADVAGIIVGFAIHVMIIDYMSELSLALDTIMKYL